MYGQPSGYQPAQPQGAPPHGPSGYQPPNGGYQYAQPAGAPSYAQQGYQAPQQKPHGAPSYYQNPQGNQPSGYQPPTGGYGAPSGYPPPTYQQPSQLPPPQVPHGAPPGYGHPTSSPHPPYGYQAPSAAASVQISTPAYPVPSQQPYATVTPAYHQPQQPTVIHSHAPTYHTPATHTTVAHTAISPPVVQSPHVVVGAPAMVKTIVTYGDGTIFAVPSRWTIKQAWGWSDMYIKDEWGNDVFYADAKQYSMTNNLGFTDLRTGLQIGYIKEKLKLGMPKYAIYLGGLEVGTVSQKFTLLNPKFVVQSMSGSITITGNWTAHSFVFHRGMREVAKVYRDAYSATDTYFVSIQPGEDVIFILACCIIIDKCVTIN